MFSRFADFKKCSTFASQSREKATIKQNGALVQLVRIHACHAWGHEFESRTHRFNPLVLFRAGGFFLYPFGTLLSSADLFPGIESYQNNMCLHVMFDVCLFFVSFGLYFYSLLFYVRVF